MAVQSRRVLGHHPLVRLGLAWFYLPWCEANFTSQFGNHHRCAVPVSGLSLTSQVYAHLSLYFSRLDKEQATHATVHPPPQHMCIDKQTERVVISLRPKERCFGSLLPRIFRSRPKHYPVQVSYPQSWMDETDKNQEHWFECIATTLLRGSALETAVTTWAKPCIRVFEAMTARALSLRGASSSRHQRSTAVMGG
jgi:hypothetical protein